MNYEKFYDLEGYIFNDIASNFQDRKYLTAEEFFCIVIWKANRAKSKVAKKFDPNTSLDTAIRKLTSSIYHKSTNKAKLSVLMNDYEFRLPISSAILSVLYQNEFSIYDIRVCDMLKEQFHTDYYHKLKNWTFERLWVGYEDYLRKTLEVSGKTTYREADKYLWSKSFYTQLLVDLDNRFNKM